MSLHDIERMLRQRIGLHAESVGRSAISSAVGRRMAASNIGSVHEYVEHLNACADELSELIETVVIPETWFFRDSRPFQVLKETAPSLDGARPGQPFRVLSVPCSTGEEPYSIAMTLLEAGLPAARIHVDAVDVSRRALAFARAGSYGSHSFRGEQDNAVLARYFQRDGARFRISDTVRASVRFHHGNLLDTSLPDTDGGYDVIFCRNLMIYFDDTAKQIAFRNLQRALAEHGLLFVGHAECGTVPQDLFHSAGHAFGFAFRKGRAASKTRSAPNRTTARRRLRPATRPQPQASKAPLPITPQPPEGDPLELARQMADLGRLAEARELCEAHLNDPARQVQAYYLLGLIRTAERDSEGAEEALRRALYLNPKHYEALVQMALLLEQRGERVGAARFRQRAARAAPDTGEERGR